MKSLGLLWRLSRGYRICPWRSPYLRWRMETYWGLHAERIEFKEFWVFLWRHRLEMTRYIRWAADRDKKIGPRLNVSSTTR